MIGDDEDMLGRIKSVLPGRWFGDSTPVLDTILAGPAWLWSSCHTSISFAKLQLRLTTASEAWLEALSFGYFGTRVQRRAKESDDSFRSRLLKELLRERGTRAAVVTALTDLTTRVPVIFEPVHTGDTGGWGSSSGLRASGLCYGSAGGWGNLCHPFQVFVTAFRPVANGGPVGVGWGHGGYNFGYSAYTDLEAIRGRVTDRDICRAVSDVLPVGTTAWVRITG
jgi:hypothetical protein